MIAVPLMMLPSEWERIKAALREGRPRLDAGDAAGSGPREPYSVERGVAVLDVGGPLYKSETFANAFLAGLFGGTAYGQVQRDLGRALGDPGVRAIVLSVHSPGGEAFGAGATAAAVRAAHGRKPVVAHVSGMAASAGYYVASGAGTIVADRGSELGSIGAAFDLIDDSEFLAKLGLKSYPIVSEQSPHKWPDIATEAGRMDYQIRANEAAQEFIDDVAANLGVTSLKVMEDFGGGAMLRSADAVRVGMAHRLGTFADAVAAAIDAANNRGAPGPAHHSGRPLVAGYSTPVTVRA